MLSYWSWRFIEYLVKGVSNFQRVLWAFSIFKKKELWIRIFFADPVVFLNVDLDPDPVLQNRGLTFNFVKQYLMKSLL